MGGGTSVADINTVRNTIGDAAFNKLADDSLQRMVADSVDKTTGDFSFTSFFKKWNNIPSNVREAMFKDAVNKGVIDDAVSQTHAINASGVLDQTKVNIKDITKSMSDLLGNGNVSTLLKDPARVQVLGAAVGPDAMQELGKSVLQNQLREASTDATGKIGNVNTGKVLDFIKSLKDSPEVTNALFKVTPEAEANYNKLMTSLKDVQSVKTAIKFGIIAPTLASGAAIGHAMGSTILGLLAAGTGEVAAKDFIEKIANSPRTWNTIKALNTAVQSKPALGAGMLSRYAAGKGVNYLKNAMLGTQGQLSNQ
jgi:hypothetical protein